MHPSAFAQKNSVSRTRRARKHARFFALRFADRTESADFPGL